MTKGKSRQQFSIKNRTFSLFPCGEFNDYRDKDEFIQKSYKNSKNSKKFLWSDSGDIAHLKLVFEQIRDLQNVYLDKMLEIASDTNNLNYFKLPNVQSTGYIYNNFGLSALNTAFSERIGRYCLQSPFQATRNYLMRNYDLHNIAECLVSYLTQNHDLKSLFLFLYEKSPNSFKNSVFNLLGSDVFGNARDLPIYFLHNMLGQIRNILFSKLDPSLLHGLNVIYESLVSSDLLDKVLSSFSRRMSSYFSWIMRFKSIDNPDFKKTIDILRRQIKTNILSFTASGVTPEFFRDLQEKAFQSELEFLKRFLIAGFFREFTPRAKFRFHEYYDAFISNREQFESFFAKMFVHDFKRFALSFYHSVLKEALVEEFIRRNYGNILDTFNFIRQNDIKSFVNRPQIRKKSLPINSSENFKYVNRQNFPCACEGNSYVQLNFYPRKVFLFRINDKNGIIKKVFQNRGDSDNMGFPTISFREFILHDKYKSLQIKKFAKILLSVPFEFQKEVSINNPNEICVDLNIKHFAVISVMEKISHRTVVIFFIGQRELFDKNFDTIQKKFVFRSRFDESKKARPKSRRKSNIFRKLYILRKRANKWQRLLKTSNDSEREFYSALFSQTWQHIRNINREIVRLLSSVINKIAITFHGDIKMEHLKWHISESKRASGKFLAFWNIHFLFSQIEEFTENTAKFSGIPFYRVDPRGTSTRCSGCGYEGSLVGRTFFCENVKCGLILNRDLNATRNIHTAPLVSSYSTKLGSVKPLFRSSFPSAL